MRGRSNVMYPTAEELIQALGLQPHPEGGAFAETYRCPLTLHTHAEGNLATAIYFVLRGGQSSAWHKVVSDELFLHQGGDPYLLRRIDETGALIHEPVGIDVAAGQRPQRLVPANQWQAAVVVAGGQHGYALVACIVTPGFDYADFQMATPDQVGELYPHLVGQLDLVTA